MSLQAFNSVKNITLDNNNYLVLSQNRTGDEFQIDYTWGKVHFQTGGTLKNGTPEHVKLRMLKNDVWYDYAGISGHGIFFEETRWKNNKDEVRIELPAKFSGVSRRLITAILSG